MKILLLAAAVAAAWPFSVHADTAIATATDACTEGIHHLERALPRLPEYGAAELQQVMNEMRAAEPGGEKCSKTDPRGLYIAAIGQVIVVWVKHAEGDDYATDLELANQLLSKCEWMYFGTRMGTTCEVWHAEAVGWKVSGFPIFDPPPSP